ncbi:hypothetical protein WMO40_12640 [Bacillaceae bacterium CLA-AA-H227]|uniref:Uncharacterized protein n=1 Tax=Robertmurraya yapensis (ex Hitch et al 2024) TaxID=3133160 RepID=A0ACC6SBS8_9BACI
MKCRGEESRIKLVNDYQLKPVAHVKLLNGQTKKSCTGDILTDSYYCFTYKNKVTKSEGSLLCGTHAATHFLSLLGHAPLRQFNPLSSIAVGGNNGNSPTSTSVRWNPTAKELHNAINLLVICWNTTIKGFVGDIKRELEKNPDKEPHLSKIKTINTIIKHDKKQRTLQQMISELRQNNQTLRNFSFNNLNQLLIKKEIDSFFG